jgi:hypothetical protein
MIKIPTAVRSQNNPEKQILHNIAENNYSRNHHMFKQLVIH